MNTWLSWLEEASRQLLGALPAVKSLAAITFCAVLYGTICWSLGRAVLAMAGFGFDALLRAFGRKPRRTASRASPSRLSADVIK